MKKDDLRPKTAYFSLPGLFEFYELYKRFLPVFRTNRDFFYDWVDISSIYGSPEECIWSGGRFECAECKPEEALELCTKYGISARLTFSNSQIRTEHLSDNKCNNVCRLFEMGSRNATDHRDAAGHRSTAGKNIRNGIVIHSDLLLNYLKEKYPGFYFISSTTKVITDFDEFLKELRRDDFEYIVPDFRLNKQLEKLATLTDAEKDKVEFLVNECCYAGCSERKACYENVSRRIIGEECPEHICKSPGSEDGYLFSNAMKNPQFIGIEDIKNTYLPNGFCNFKIEGRGLGSAMVLEMLLYYLVKPKYQIEVREKIYLNGMLDLF